MLLYEHHSFIFPRNCLTQLYEIKFDKWIRQYWCKQDNLFSHPLKFVIDYKTYNRLYCDEVCTIAITECLFCYEHRSIGKSCVVITEVL